MSPSRSRLWSIITGSLVALFTFAGSPVAQAGEFTGPSFPGWVVVSFQLHLAGDPRPFMTGGVGEGCWTAWVRGPIRRLAPKPAGRQIAAESAFGPIQFHWTGSLAPFGDPPWRSDVWLKLPRSRAALAVYLWVTPVGADPESVTKIRQVVTSLPLVGQQGRFFADSSLLREVVFPLCAEPPAGFEESSFASELTHAEDGVRRALATILYEWALWSIPPTWDAGYPAAETLTTQEGGHIVALGAELYGRFEDCFRGKDCSALSRAWNAPRVRELAR